MVLTCKEIARKYHGMFGVFTHDMHKASDEDYAHGFLKAFESWAEALMFAKEYGENTAIHII